MHYTIINNMFLACWLRPVLIVLLLLVGGCAPISKVVPTTWHQKCGWKAEDYFDDPKVIALCHAIEANDLAEIDRLVAAGANVKAVGKGKMTPLLWAYPDNKLARFTRLLEHGADPNVIVESDFNTHGGIIRGDSVTQMACKTEFPGYFEAVFSHGGDPNLVGTGIIPETPLFMVIGGMGHDKIGRVQMLIKRGANLDQLDGAECTPAMTAVVRRQFDIALVILKAGADPMIYRPRSNTRLVHVLVGTERTKETWTNKQKLDYSALSDFLTQRGESLDEARADLRRWRSWSHTNGEFSRKMDAEVAARKAKEAREKKQPKE